MSKTRNFAEVCGSFASHSTLEFESGRTETKLSQRSSSTSFEVTSHSTEVESPKSTKSPMFFALETKLGKEEKIYLP